MRVNHGGELILLYLYSSIVMVVVVSYQKLLGPGSLMPLASPTAQEEGEEDVAYKRAICSFLSDPKCIDG